MADTEEPSALASVARGDKITVTVLESCLPDIIVVVFAHGARSFQGALLDATKRGLPCGVQPPEPVPGPDADKLATIAARFSYFQEKKAAPMGTNKIDLRRNINPPARYKNARPTVRLRPRQVLCSKCRSICNENSENVDVSSSSRKRKLDAAAAADQTPPVRRSDRRLSQPPQKNQRSLFPEYRARNLRSAVAATAAAVAAPTTEEKDPLSPDTVDSSTKPSESLAAPKISARLQPNEIADVTQSTGKAQLASDVREASYWPCSNGVEEASWNPAGVSSEVQAEPSELDSTNPSTAYCATPRRLSSSSVESAKVPDEDEKKTLAAADSTVIRPKSSRIPRKKRAAGAALEDLWNEPVFEDPSRTARATPVIKISFGAQGEGTVLKIPSKIQDPYVNEADTDTEDAQPETERDPLELPASFDAEKAPEVADAEEGLQEQLDPQKQSGKDASAKAAKRALKKAKKEARRKMLGGVSPARSPCNLSPRYTTTFDPISYHRRKHKVKHKKKHKEERKHKSLQPSATNREPEHEEETPRTVEAQESGLTTTTNGGDVRTPGWNARPGGEAAYTAIKEQCLKQKLSISLKRLNTNAYAARCDYPVSNASSGCKSPGASSDELSEPEPEVDAAETAPDFPPPSHPLAIRLAATPVAHCLTASGRRMDVGDVVWGKIHGFPWWPGKVLSISVSCNDEGNTSGAQAHVAWYGSSTCSLMSCDRLSPFLETFKARYNKKKRGPYKEAIRQAQSEARSQIAPNSTTSGVLSVCGSPREVNVLS